MENSEPAADERYPCIDAMRQGHKAHHWEITSGRDLIDGTAVYHHRCIRCGAEKDVPVQQTSNRWISRSRRSKDDMVEIAGL